MQNFGSKSFVSVKQITNISYGNLYIFATFSLHHHLPQHLAYCPALSFQNANQFDNDVLVAIVCQVFDDEVLFLVLVLALVLV